MMFSKSFVADSNISNLNQSSKGQTAIKKSTVFVCTECGFESSKWNGKCSECGKWNTLEEQEIVKPLAASKGKALSSAVSYAPAVSSKLAEIDAAVREIRYQTGISELDRVLGGGLVKGSLVLLGGEPGIGKSTILLQICEYLGKEHTVLYISGEESARQIKLRADRLGVKTENLSLLSVNNAEVIADTIRKNKPDIAIIDSIQTMSIYDISSSPGSITQVRECTNLFMRTAKELEIPIFIVGHVNKDGAIAGPKIMEHIVDTVLYFEGERSLSYRVLRAVKNRFGSTNEIGVFEMAESGLREVLNPSAMLLEGRPVGVSGTCVTCEMNGNRPILVEIQALAAKTSFPQPRRVGSGIDYSRMLMLIAVLEKRLGIYCGGLDIYINVVGGFRLTERASDLAIIFAMRSAVLDKALADNICAVGEVGLGGEVRSVPFLDRRVSECQRMGFQLVNRLTANR
ncbi:MAG: DNA repair protein RadA [Ruminococcus sp.]|jgi:DNA repair protein RadA/Sms|nr:DNA repair protein RadA [Ruminococcus sp.]